MMNQGQSFEELWGHVPVPDGYYAEELVATHTHRHDPEQEFSSDHEASAVQEAVEEQVAEIGGKVLAGPVARGQHKMIYLVAFPFPENVHFREFYPAGYWVAKVVFEPGEGEEMAEIDTPKVPFRTRTTHECTGATKADATRHLVGFLRFLEAQMSGGVPAIIVAVPNMPFDTLHQN